MTLAEIKIKIREPYRIPTVMTVEKYVKALDERLKAESEGHWEITGIGLSDNSWYINPFTVDTKKLLLSPPYDKGNPNMRILIRRIR